MGSFKRALLGYRREDVDAAMRMRDSHIWTLEHKLEKADGEARDAAKAAVEAEDTAMQAEAVAALAERELASLSGMVIEREREIRNLKERLEEANRRHDRSIASLETTAGRLDEIQAQARGQATRIRMKALREAAEVSRRTQELVDAQSEEGNGATPSNGDGAADLGDVFEGLVKVEIGPLDDFSQLVGFQDAIGTSGGSEISIERFSEGRATVSMRLNEPVELLRKLEEHAPLDFQVRRTSKDNLILDIDEDSGPEQQAA